MSAATISLLAPAGSADYVALTAALALLAGVISIAAGLLKLGRIAQFFSESVLLGFVFGLALLITIKQIPKLLGIEAHGDSAVQLLIDIIPQVDETDLATLAVGVAGIAAMILMERLLPRVPAALVVMLGVDRWRRSPSASRRTASRSSGDLPAGLKGPSLPGVGLEALPLLLRRRGRDRPRRLRRGHRPGQRVRPEARRQDRPEPRARRARRRERRRRPLLRLPDRLVALQVGRERPRRSPDAGLAGRPRPRRRPWWRSS